MGAPETFPFSCLLSINLLSIGLCSLLPGSHLKILLWGSFGQANIQRARTLILYEFCHLDVSLRLQDFLNLRTLFLGTFSLLSVI